METVPKININASVLGPLTGTTLLKKRKFHEVSSTLSRGDKEKENVTPSFTQLVMFNKENESNKSVGSNSLNLRLRDLKLKDKIKPL